MNRRLPGLEERHPAAAARHQHRLHPRAAQQQSAGPLEPGGIVIDADAQDLFDFGLVRCAGGETSKVEESIPRVEEYWNGPAAAAARDAAAEALGKRRRHETGAVIRQQNCIAAIERRLN